VASPRSPACCRTATPSACSARSRRWLLAAVLAEDEYDDRSAALDAALAPLATEPPAPYLDPLALMAATMDDRTPVRVDQVAARGRMSVRSLQRLFAAYAGVSPKAVLARYRLQDAAATIDDGTADDLARLATSLGWFDQAHFTRDLRAVVGIPPSASLRRARGQTVSWVPVS
jgi:transcriptional regulator GlxA family with amidase domain